MSWFMLTILGLLASIFRLHEAYFFLTNTIYLKIRSTVPIYLFTLGVSPCNCKGKLYYFIVKEMFIEIGFKEFWVLKNLFPMTYIFQGNYKIVEIY